MRKQKFFLVGILIVALLVTGGFTGCSGIQLTDLEGIIQNIDSLSGIVTVKMKDGSTLTFNFADVKAETIIQALGGLSIEVGDTVTVRLDDEGEVQEVEGDCAEVDGIVEGLSPDSVVIAAEEGADITLAITPETLIHIEDGGAGNLSDLQVGQQVEARYDVVSLEALEIEIEDADEEGEIEGIIAAIDAGNYMVTITTEEQGDIVVQVTPDTEIEVEDDGEGVFADLQLGLQVEVDYDASSMEASEIEVGDGD